MNSFYTEVEIRELGFKTVGNNVQISRKASLYETEKMIIGSNVRIDDFALMSGKIVIGNNVHIAAYAALYGGNAGIILEDYVGVSSRCAIYAASDDYLGTALTNPTVPIEYRKVNEKEVKLEKHVLIGTGTTILPGITIQTGTAVGSMSLVNRSLDDWGIYVGIPCRCIKERDKELLKLEEEYKQKISRVER